MRHDHAMAIRLFLVDDHELVLRGLRELVAHEDDIEVVGEATTVALALARVPSARADVAVLDVRLPDGSGVELCRELRERQPSLACLMLTSYADDEAELAAIMAGAAGYVLKQIRGADLVGAIRAVAGGGTLLDPKAASRVIERLRRGPARDPRLADLTEQERRVLALLAEGLTNREIGDRLFLAEKTVKNYVSAILAKLGMRRRTEAAAFAARLDPTELADPPPGSAPHRSG